MHLVTILDSKFFDSTKAMMLSALCRPFAYLSLLFVVSSEVEALLKFTQSIRDLSASVEMKES
jgi:hypothetical protein